MLKGITVGLTALAMLVASCGGSGDTNNSTFSCDTAKSKCSADGMIPKEICDMLNDPACNTVFLEFASCAVAHQICKDDMTTDFPSTIKMCQSQYDKAQACNDAHMDGGTSN